MRETKSYIRPRSAYLSELSKFWLTKSERKKVSTKSPSSSNAKAMKILPEIRHGNFPNAFQLERVHMSSTSERMCSRVNRCELASVLPVAAVRRVSYIQWPDWFAGTQCSRVSKNVRCPQWTHFRSCPCKPLSFAREYSDFLHWGQVRHSNWSRQTQVANWLFHHCVHVRSVLGRRS